MAIKKCRGCGEHFGCGRGYARVAHAKTCSEACSLSVRRQNARDYYWRLSESDRRRWRERSAKRCKDRYHSDPEFRDYMLAHGRARRAAARVVEEGSA